MDGEGRTASGTAVERSHQRILRSRHSHILMQHNAGAVAETVSPSAPERRDLRADRCCDDCAT